VQLRTTWSGQSRVAAISSELSPEMMPQNDQFILCEWHRHDPLQLDASTMTRGHSSFTYRRCCQPDDRYLDPWPSALRSCPVAPFRNNAGLEAYGPRLASRDIPTSTVPSVRSSSQSIRSSGERPSDSSLASRRP
jgi:hypothetical protein